MRIGELAGTTGTTPRALRHYEQAGLISSKRAPNGYRTYDEHAVVRVRNIRYLLAVLNERITAQTKIRDRLEAALNNAAAAVR